MASEVEDRQGPEGVVMGLSLSWGMRPGHASGQVDRMASNFRVKEANR